MLENHYSTFYPKHQKGAICLNVGTYIHEKGLSFRGSSPPDPLTRGSAPGPRWGLCPQTPVIASRSALAMGFSPLKFLVTSLLHKLRIWINKTSRVADNISLPMKCNKYCEKAACY